MKLAVGMRLTNNSVWWRMANRNVAGVSRTSSRRSDREIVDRQLKNLIGKFQTRSSPLRARCSMPQPLGSTSETTVTVTISASVCADWPARDPAGEKRSLSRYRFVNNAPFEWFDSDGLFARKWVDVFGFVWKTIIRPNKKVPIDLVGDLPDGAEELGSDDQYTFADFRIVGRIRLTRSCLLRSGGAMPYYGVGYILYCRYSSCTTTKVYTPNKSANPQYQPKTEVVSDDDGHNTSETVKSGGACPVCPAKWEEKWESDWYELDPNWWKK